MTRRFRRFVRCWRAQLQEQLTRIVEERGKLVDKAQMALARVAQRYDPERHGERLYELYQECGKK